jgi:diguanylate cyclase (GGDEF)-like protein
MPTRLFGAVVGVPLTSGGRTVGVIGLASGSYERTFGPPETAALSRFAQLASIALDNAHLFEAAQRGALYDPITGLPNRDLLTDRVAHSLTWSRDSDQDPIALILLDLDRFKVINESLGHAVGDALLVQVGDRLQRCLRPGDTVARFGGDEFGIILDGIGGVDEARRTADRILAELREPFVLAERDWFVNASLGIAMAWPGRGTPGDAFREAEVALVRAKASPRQRYVLFEPEMSEATLARVDRRPRHRSDRRRRSPRPLGPSDARARAAAGVHPARRGDGADRTDRAVGSRDGLSPGTPLAGRDARQPSRDERQPLGAPIRPGLDRRGRA